MRQLNTTCETDGDSDWEQLDQRAPPVHAISFLKKEAEPISEKSLLILNYRMDNVKKIRFSERYVTELGKPERKTHRWEDNIKMIRRMDASITVGTV